MKPLIIVRPEPGARATLLAARELGLEAHVHPIFAVRPVPWAPVPQADVDAVILGSANALRQAGPALDALRRLPAYCVGKTTAIAAQEAGLKVIRVGSGELQNVLNALEPKHRRLLRLAGVTRLELKLPPNVTMVTREVYASDPLPMDDALAQVLEQPAVVMLHSGEAAAHFAAICLKAAVDHTQIALAVIGPRVAEMAENLSETPWSKVVIAAEPSDAALLALAHEMCQEAVVASKKPR